MNGVVCGRVHSALSRLSLYSQDERRESRSFYAKAVVHVQFSDFGSCIFLSRVYLCNHRLSVGCLVCLASVLYMTHGFHYTSQDARSTWQQLQAAVRERQSSEQSVRQECASAPAVL